MALPKAKPGDVIDVRPFGSEIANATTEALFKSETLEVIRMVMPKGKAIPQHQVTGPITLHCLEGAIEITALGETRELAAGELVYLPAAEPHAVRCLDAASFLLTIVLTATA
jgi:quercetin dioxygenase-like cupin family protein